MLALAWTLAMPWVGQLASAPVESPAEALELEWSAPEACPGSEDVHRAIASRLSAPGDEERGLAVVRAHGVVHSVPEGYRLDLQLWVDGSQGTRTIEAETCPALADAASLVIALAIDPSLSTAPAVETPEPEPSPPTPSTDDAIPALVPERPERSSPTEADASAPSTEPEPSPASPPSEAREPNLVSPSRPDAPELHLDLSGLAGPGFFLLPQTVGFIELEVGLSGRGWRVSIGANVWTPARERSQINPSVGGRFLAWASPVRACYAPVVGSVDFALCPGVELGAIHGEGTGMLDPARRDASLWAAALGSGSVRWWPRALGDRLGLFLRVEGLASLTRPSFGTQSSGVIYQAPLGALRLGGGLSLRLL